MKQGDALTLGFGSTTLDDGSPVCMGNMPAPLQALKRTLAHIQAGEADMRQTLEGVALHRAEYGVYIDWPYLYGSTA